MMRLFRPTCIIMAKQALGQLVYKKVNYQICIRSQVVIDLLKEE